MFKHKAIWCGVSEAGKTQEAVAEYVERMHRAGINAILVHLKGGDGRVYWPSKILPQATAEGYKDFDAPAALLKECRKRGLRLEVWFIDFFESPNGPAYREHPEWAMLNANGEPTTSETLRGQKFGGLWMCPARRPGYTDQWLVPLYKEFAELYDFDAVHHDYIRYPGDLAPDQYCFCDYCLEEMPRFNGFYSQKFPNESFFHESYDRPYLEAHWEQSPRVLPANWPSMNRQFKSRFLLEESFFQGGRNDLDYFIYTYRTHWITQFARESAEAVRAARPGMQISAAVFKNPIHSGRFIGQDWRQFAPYVDGCIPMDYRDHYPGSFETYLDLLEETITSQKEWARDFKYYWVGFAINFLFFEEERPLRKLVNSFDKAEYEKIAPRIRIAAPDAYEKLTAALAKGDHAAFQAEFNSFANNLPHAYWPKEKFVKVLERIKSCYVEGISIFCEGHLHQYGLWETLSECLS